MVTRASGCARGATSGARGRARRAMGRSMGRRLGSARAEGARASVDASGTSTEDAVEDVETDETVETEDAGEAASGRTPEDELLTRIEARRNAMFKRGRTRMRVSRTSMDVDGSVGEEETVEGARLGEEGDRTTEVAGGGGASSSARVGPAVEMDVWKKTREDATVGRPRLATELVWVLERPGEGWGEQIFPSLTAMRRVVDTSAPQKMLTLGERYLVEEIGLTEDETIAATSAAAAWRTTKKGRALVDKRRLRFAQKNILIFVQALFEFGAGKDDVALILRKFPILLSLECDNKWNMRLLEYTVRQKTEKGGSQGPIRTKGYPGRAPQDTKREDRMKDEYMMEWINTQRDQRKIGQLTAEQIYLLDSIGFDADKNLTKYDMSRIKRWDVSFEELIAFQMASGLTNPPYEPGMTTGLGAWLEEQRELYRRGELSEKKEKRLRAQGIAFDPLEALEEARRLANTAIRDVTSEPVETSLLNTQFTQSAIELRAFLDENGPYAEPQIGSPLGVWLMKTRGSIRDGTLDEVDAKVLEELELDITYIPESWIAMFNTYSELRAKRSNVLGVDILKVQAWHSEQLTLMKRNDGSLSEAQLNRLRAASRFDSIAGFASNAVRAVREERAKEFAEFEARVAARKARLEKLQQLSLNSIDEGDENEK